MKLLKVAIVLSSLSACGGTSISPEIVSSGGAQPTTLSQAPLVPQVQAITDPSGDASFGSLLNDLRIENRSGEVTYNARLNTAAQRHANDMLENDYFSHTGLNGSSVGTRVQAAGYNFRRVGENIAAGYQTEESVLEGWKNSPGHQRNNIDPNFEDFGLGYARDGNRTRWVLVLGTEQ